MPDEYCFLCASDEGVFLDVTPDNQNTFGDQFETCLTAKVQWIKPAEKLEKPARNYAPYRYPIERVCVLYVCVCVSIRHTPDLLTALFAYSLMFCIFFVHVKFAFVAKNKRENAKRLECTV